MKTNLFSILLVSLSLSASPLVTQDPTIDYQPQAQQWAEKVIKGLDRAYCVDLLDLLYASYMRSYMTLVVQRDYIELLNRVGSGWNHIINTRLNPSKDNAFDESTIMIDDRVIQQLEAFHLMCTAQKKYVELTDRLVNNNAQDFRPCKVMIDDLRENARTVVAESLIQVMDEIQQEIQKAQEAISQAAALFKTEGQLKHNNFLNRSVTELLWYYVPHLMVKSFVNFDKGYTAGSKQCLDAYLESQKIGNEIWKRIEVARAGYYAAHYNALHKLFIEEFDLIFTLCNRTSPEIERLPDPSLFLQALTDYSCSI